MKNITVIGSGTMGNGIAHTFAQFGYSVNLIDVNEAALQKAIATITKNLDRQVTKGTITEVDKANTLSNIKTFTDLKIYQFNLITSLEGGGTVINPTKK